MSEEENEDATTLSDYEYTVLITLLRIYDSLGALLEEIKPGAGKQLYDIHKDGRIIMPAPQLNGDFGDGFGEEKPNADE